MVTLNTSLARAVDEPETNRPFPVHDPGVVWFVTSGKLDVFLVRLENGEAVGARHHVLRVEEGGAIFGLPAIDGGFGLCAVAGLATRTDRRSRDEVRPEVPPDRLCPLGEGPRRRDRRETDPRRHRAGLDSARSVPSIRRRSTRVTARADGRGRATPAAGAAGGRRADSSRSAAAAGRSPGVRSAGRLVRSVLQPPPGAGV